ncbi:hypothetical protein, variant 2 [Capsaspora owczarzaki ATCC 30864]|uniref:Ubiquitin-like protease family profile domain-containing protein n=2 Tax=Capsaspora owczarzaki (strain ATCC 30864) TaxID=595528 RepID=A0A0D2UDB2_CAPO3|nr:hypothetical protein, variant 2 [Capsaspora owczarzaki ATCC 30864]
MPKKYKVQLPVFALPPCERGATASWVVIHSNAYMSLQYTFVQHLRERFSLSTTVTLSLDESKHSPYLNPFVFPLQLSCFDCCYSYQVIACYCFCRLRRSVLAPPGSMQTYGGRPRAVPRPAPQDQSSRPPEVLASSKGDWPRPQAASRRPSQISNAIAMLSSVPHIAAAGPFTAYSDAAQHSTQSRTGSSVRGRMKSSSNSSSSSSSVLSRPKRPADESAHPMQVPKRTVMSQERSGGRRDEDDRVLSANGLAAVSVSIVFSNETAPESMQSSGMPRQQALSHIQGRLESGGRLLFGERGLQLLLETPSFSAIRADVCAQLQRYAHGQAVGWLRRREAPSTFDSERLSRIRDEEDNFQLWEFPYACLRRVRVPTNSKFIQINLNSNIWRDMQRTPDSAALPLLPNWLIVELPVATSELNASELKDTLLDKLVASRTSVQAHALLEVECGSVELSIPRNFQTSLSGIPPARTVGQRQVDSTSTNTPSLLSIVPKTPPSRVVASLDMFNTPSPTSSSNSLLHSSSHVSGAATSSRAAHRTESAFAKSFYESAGTLRSGRSRSSSLPSRPGRRFSEVVDLSDISPSKDGSEDAVEIVTPASARDLTFEFESQLSRPFLYAPAPKVNLLITNADLARLKSGEFLNDVILQFYLWYIEYSLLSEAQRARWHVFSSYFYLKLTTQRTDKSPARLSADEKAKLQYENVKSWTRDVDIFSKDFVAVPVNENAHWYLIVICFAGQYAQAQSVENPSEEVVASDDVFEDTKAANLAPTTPRIIVMDSLGAQRAHASPVKLIKRYLTLEWANKRPNEPAVSFDKMPLVKPQVGFGLDVAQLIRSLQTPPPCFFFVLLRRFPSKTTIAIAACFCCTTLSSLPPIQTEGCDVTRIGLQRQTSRASARPFAASFYRSLKPSSTTSKSDRRHQGTTRMSLPR